MKTIYFYGLSKLSVWVQLVLIDGKSTTKVELDYSYGATKITFPNELRGIVGKAVGRAIKGRNFRKVENV